MESLFDKQIELWSHKESLDKARSQECFSDQLCVTLPCLVVCAAAQELHLTENWELRTAPHSTTGFPHSGPPASPNGAAADGQAAQGQPEFAFHRRDLNPADVEGSA